MNDRKYSLSNFPLSWPADWRRTPAHQIHSAKFLRNKQLPSIMEGMTRALTQLEAMGIRRDDVLVSTNIPTRLDGLPRSDQREPTDRGVAVYWRKGQDGPMRCIAIDIYNRVADNLCAVAATLEAMRAIERHGGAQVQERTFRGFAALPNKTGPRPWREVLNPGGSEPPQWTRGYVENSYRHLAKQCHPDVAGGSHDEMAELNRAREDALRELES